MPSLQVRIKPNEYLQSANKAWGVSSTPKTIQIFLPFGDPQGIRISEITTRIVQAIEVPRALLPQFIKMPEAEQVALYFLLGQDEQSEPLIYVGQSSDLKTRMGTHNREKDFWDSAIIVISRTHSLTQTHTLFLEWFCLGKIREAGRCEDCNGNAASRPHTPAPLEADCLEIYDTAKTLISTLGYPVFDPVAAAVAVRDPNEIFFCRGSEADGRGMYTSEGFVVLAGSSERTETTQSFDKFSLGKHRESLLAAQVLKETDGRLVFQKDHLFRSPSQAALVLMGRSANGWVEWKNDKGQTLDEVKRQIDE